MSTLKELQKEISDWADAVFPDRTAHGALCKLMLEEIPEFALDNSGEDEYADIAILLLDIATLNGIDVEGAIKRKMERNRARQWRVDRRTGLMKHVEKDDERGT